MEVRASLRDLSPCRSSDRPMCTGEKIQHILFDCRGDWVMLVPLSPGLVCLWNLSQLHPGEDRKEVQRPVLREDLSVL
jgi:hypothetical protein